MKELRFMIDLPLLDEPLCLLRLFLLQDICSLQEMPSILSVGTEAAIASVSNRFLDPAVCFRPECTALLDPSASFSRKVPIECLLRQAVEPAVGRVEERL